VTVAVSRADGDLVATVTGVDTIATVAVCRPVDPGRTG